jgi:hypothetical protein
MGMVVEFGDETRDLMRSDAVAQIADDAVDIGMAGLGLTHLQAKDGVLILQ